MKVRGLLLEVEGLHGVSDDYFSQWLTERISVPSLPDNIVVTEKTTDENSNPRFSTPTTFQRYGEQLSRAEFLSLCQDPRVRESGLWIRVTGEVELWGGGLVGAYEISASDLKIAAEGGDRHEMAVTYRLMCDVIEVLTPEEVAECTDPE